MKICQGLHRKPHAERRNEVLSTERVRMQGVAVPLINRNALRCGWWHGKVFLPCRLPLGERGDYKGQRPLVLFAGAWGNAIPPNMLLALRSSKTGRGRYPKG